jgi:hypothetical protein
MNCPHCDQRLAVLGCIFQEKGRFLIGAYCYNKNCDLSGKLIKITLKENLNEETAYES